MASRESTGTVRAIIFDAGGVLHDRNIEAVKDDLLEELALEQDTLQAIWKEHLPLLGSGKIDEAEFWRQVRVAHGVRQVDVAENLLGRMFIESLTPHMEVLTIVRELGRRGVKLAVLSNTIEPHARALQEAGQFEDFDRVFLSNEVGLRKPDRAIYQHVLDELDVEPQEMVFIDDDEVNVKAARALGIHGIVYIDPASLLADLREFVPDLELPQRTP